MDEVAKNLTLVLSVYVTFLFECYLIFWDISAVYGNKQVETKVFSILKWIFLDIPVTLILAFLYAKYECLWILVLMLLSMGALKFLICWLEINITNYLIDVKVRGYQSGI